MKLTNFLKLSITAAILASCGSDDNDAEVAPGLVPGLEVPSTYVFVNEEGESTVDFSGQTTRLRQGIEILKDFTTFGTTQELLDGKFAGGEGFIDATLNGSKTIKSKVAETFSAVNQAEVRAVFDGYIEDQADILLEEFANAEAVSVATVGNVGKLERAGGAGFRFVNANGLELNQAFNKGLIGALALDQIVNDYLTLTEGVAEQAANTGGLLVEGKTYTDAEHHWDEAYGYLYGASDEEVLANPNSRHLERANVVDAFLYKYLQRAEEDADFKGIADEVFQAFKTGRAAIVANDYVESKRQADIIRRQLSEVIGIRAVFYIKEGVRRIGLGQAEINNGNAFHDLSEGYGFVYSLQFTNDPTTGEAYFSPAEVKGFIERLDAENGFWTLADNTAELNAIADEIAARFNFTVEQAESLDAAN